jgi:hypothetical protein
MVAQIPVQDTDEQEKQIITIDVISSLSFLLTVPCKLSAKPTSPAYIAKQEQTTVNITAIEIFSPFGSLEVNSF